MTPDELRRLADRKVAAAAEYVADAGRLRTRAAALFGILDPLLAISQRVWTGPAARDFESEVRINTEILNEQATRLREIAAELERRADSERRDAAELRARAVAAEAVALAGQGVA